YPDRHTAFEVHASMNILTAGSEAGASSLVEVEHRGYGIGRAVVGGDEADLNRRRRHTPLRPYSAQSDVAAVRGAALAGDGTVGVLDDLTVGELKPQCPAIGACAGGVGDDEVRPEQGGRQRRDGVRDRARGRRQLRLRGEEDLAGRVQVG